MFIIVLSSCNALCYNLVSERSLGLQQQGRAAQHTRRQQLRACLNASACARPCAAVHPTSVRHACCFAAAMSCRDRLERVTRCKQHKTCAADQRSGVVPGPTCVAWLPRYSGAQHDDQGNQRGDHDSARGGAPVVVACRGCPQGSPLVSVPRRAAARLVVAGGSSAPLLPLSCLSF